MVMISRRRWIDRGRSLPEFRRYTPRPGDPDWRRLVGEARALAARLLPRLAPPPSRGVDRLRALAAHGTAAENYAINYRRHRAGREDLLPLYFIWTTHRGCNFRCTYCDDHRGRSYPDLPKDGTLSTSQGKLLQTIMRTRTPSVYYAGGEPTLRGDLPELLRHARELAYYPISINTNGSVIHRQLARPRWRTALADLDIVVVSIDRLDLTAAAELWKHDRPEEVFRNLLLLRELAGPMRFKLMINTVIQPGHVSEALAVLDLANDLGLHFAPVPMNVGPRVHPGLRVDPEYPVFVEELLSRKRSGAPIVGSLRMNRRLLRSEPKACRNTLKPHVDHDGHLIWPCKSAMNVAPVKLNVLDYSGVDALYAAACKEVEPTRFHGQARNQCGAECNWAQNYSTDAYVHGLEHPLSMVKDVAAFVGQ